MKKYYQKILRFFGVAISILLLVFLLLYFLLQQPSVQTWTVNKITTQLSLTLNANVAIESVDIEFFKTAVLNGIHIKDQNADTLLFADRLKVNIGVFSILQKKILLSDIQLENGNIQLYKNIGDTTFNFTFLVDAFTSKDTTTKISTSAPWDFDINNIGLEKIRFSYRDEVSGTEWKSHIQTFEGAIEKLDIPNQSIILNTIDFKNSSIVGNVFHGVEDKVLDTLSIPQKEKIKFPYSGWDLELNVLKFEDNTFGYKDLRRGESVEGVNVNDLLFEKMNIKIEDFLWKKNEINASIKRILIKDKSGLDLKRFAADLAVDTTGINVQNLELVVNDSKINNTSTIHFSAFDDLVSQTQKLHFSTDFQNTKIAFKDIKFFQPLYGVIPFINIDAVENIFLDGKLEGGIDNLVAKNLKVRIGEQLRLEADAKLKNVRAGTKLQFDIDLKEWDTSYEQLQTFTKDLPIPEGLKNFGKMTLAAQAQGSLEEIAIQNLSFSTSAYSAFAASGIIKNITHVDELLLDLEIENLQTRAADLVGFMPNGLPPILDSLGDIQYVGKFDGTLRKFDLKGGLKTDIGNVNSDIFLDFVRDYSSASYLGKISTEEFQLGKLLSQADLGTITLEMKVQGEGFVLDSLNAVAEGQIKQFIYNNYEYTDLKLDGDFDKKKFNGFFKSNDKNARLNFVGTVDLNNEIPDFGFQLTIDTLNLKKLNLYPNDLQLSTRMDVNLRGDNLDDIVGYAKIFDLNLSQDSSRFHTDSILMAAQQVDNKNKILTLDSEFMNATMEGDYHIEEFPEMVKGFIEEFISLDALNLNDSKGNNTITDVVSTEEQKFQLSLQVINPILLTKIFIPKLLQLDTVDIIAKFNTSTKDIGVEGMIKSLDFDGIKTDSIVFDTKGSIPQIVQVIEFNNLNIQEQAQFAKATINSRLVRDSLNLKLGITGEEEQTKLSLGGAVTAKEDLMKLKLNPRFILNDSLWNIDSENELLYGNDILVIHDLIVQKDNQILTINSGQKENTAESIDPINIAFEKFQLSEIFQLITPAESYVSGELNGTATLIDLLGNLHYNADLGVPLLKIDGKEAGTLSVLAEQLKSEKKISVEVDLLGENDAFTARGYYNIDSREFDVMADVKKMELSLLDPYLQTIINDSEGSISGKFEIKGTPEVPNFKGYLDLNNISTVIAVTKARYQIGEERITINNKEIDLEKMVLKDKQGRTADLVGKILHKNFSDFRLDLGVKTDEFLFLNTTATDSPLFYGKLNLSADLTVKGLLEKPNVQIVARTLANSEFNLSPFAESDIIVEEDYIIFGNPNTYVPEDTTLSAYQIKNAFPFDVNLNLELTDATTFQFIVDPLSGDKLSCKGNSNLIINMKPSGEIEMFGNYTISSGAYNFSYGELVKREFSIRQGSSVSFVGDPLSARFNVVAERTTNSTTFELISNETTLNESEISESQKRQTVKVLLNLTGDLSGPQITFDIELPENEGTVITSAIERKLESLRNDTNELNKQVFGLLLLNSFIASSTASSTLAGLGESTIYSSVSKLFSNQLNKLADRYIKGVDVSIDVNSYRSEYLNQGAGGTVTEVGVGLSKQLFNDRLTIKASGNMDLNSSSSSTGFNTIAGDFVLEYKLTESGNYLLKVFRKSDYDVLTDADATKNGVGFKFKKAFGKKK